jgi:two-component system, OmpR family, sensor histidine kinase TctE
VSSTTRPRPSLRRSLLLWLLWPLLLIAPAAAGLQYLLTLRPALRAFDHSLGTTVISIANFVRMGPQGLQFEMSAQTERSIRTDQTDAIFYAVTGPQGELLAGDPPLTEPSINLAAQEWHFYDARVFDQAVRVGARGVACGDAVCQVRVAQTRSARDALRNDMLTGTALSLLLLTAALALAALVATARGLRPLRRLSQQMGSRSLTDLRPLAASDVPREALPVVDAVNRLFERVNAGSAAQQAFLADAAHQLRTPLATLKTEAELAVMQPHPPELAATLQRINGAASRAARLGSQLLSLARSDASVSSATPTEAVDLKQLAGAAVDEWVPRALAAHIDLGFELQPATVNGHGVLLQELLANLLHNALAYAGAGAHVTVRTHTLGGEATLEVEDNGPGIAREDRQRVLQRFQRGAQSLGQGSGLGLAIVSDIAQAHGAQLLLSEGCDGKGLRVQVAFGPVAFGQPAWASAAPQQVTP